MQLSREQFKLKAPCADCPFRKVGGVRHGLAAALNYTRYFTRGTGETFPCHRTVAPELDRSTWSEWGENQQMCAGGLAFAENIGFRSRTVTACIDAGVHDPESLTERDAVFGSTLEMLFSYGEKKVENNA